jgi:hypothetical protein
MSGWREPVTNGVLLMAGIAAVVVYSIGTFSQVWSTTGTATEIRRSVN